MLPARDLIGTVDLLLVTFDTLRYDVAQRGIEEGRTPLLASLLPNGTWERRHTPGSFTYAAHQAFFAGFLPTPVSPGPHPRLFAARFAGSETTAEQTFVYDAPTLVEGLRNVGYQTICVGGVGFFNQASALGSALPSLFDEAHWSRALGVTDPESTRNQVSLACESLDVAGEQLTFLFLNLSAMHQPNCYYVEGATEDSPETQLAALAYVDRELQPLFARLRSRRKTLCLLMSDHGTCYGEEGYVGHRLAHPAVWEVPYAEFVLDAEV